MVVMNSRGRSPASTTSWRALVGGDLGTGDLTGARVRAQLLHLGLNLLVARVVLSAQLKLVDAGSTILVLYVQPCWRHDTRPWPRPPRPGSAFACPSLGLDLAVAGCPAPGCRSRWRVDRRRCRALVWRRIRRASTWSGIVICDMSGVAQERGEDLCPCSTPRLFVRRRR